MSHVLNLQKITSNTTGFEFGGLIASSASTICPPTGAAPGSLNDFEME